MFGLLVFPPWLQSTKCDYQRLLRRLLYRPLFPFPRQRASLHPPPQQHTLAPPSTHEMPPNRRRSKVFFCRKGKSYWLLFSSAPTAASKETSMRYCTHTLIFPEKKNSFGNSCKMWKQLFFETFLIVSVANVLSTLSFILQESSSLSTVRVIQRLSQVE